MAQSIGASGMYEVGQYLLVTVDEGALVFLHVAEDLFCHMIGKGKTA